MFAVMGVTGQVGGAVADRLLSRGQQIRAVVRNPEKAKQWKARGAEIAIADYDDARALRQALNGAEGVFVMMPPHFAPTPGFLEARTTLISIHTALSAVLPAKAVYLSSIGSEQTSGVGLITTTHLLEGQLRSLPIASAFLRAAWFMENFAADVKPAREEGKFFSFLQPLDHRFPMVAAEDIGRTAADLLLDQWSENRFIEVAGPREYSPLDIARALASVLGRGVEAVAVPRESWVKRFVDQGMPEDRTSPRIEMVEGFNSGWIHFGVPGTEHITRKTELTTVLQTLAAGK